MVAGMKRAAAVPDELAKALRSAHRELLDERVVITTKIGIPAFALERTDSGCDTVDY